MLIVQNSTDPIPLYVPSASGNDAGDASLTGLTVSLQQPGGNEVVLGGQVVAGKRGAYWYYPQPGDFAVPGRFLLFLNGVPNTDVPLPFAIEVEPLSLAQQVLSLPGALLAACNNMRQLAYYSVPQAQRGTIQ